MKIGVVVARFQVPYLHAGHVHLLNNAWEQSDLLLILLGEPSQPNERNILSYDERVEMIRDYYPFAVFRRIIDHNEDYLWSEHLDETINSVSIIIDHGDNGVTLFGSRDSFHKHYKGIHPYTEVPELRKFSGTNMREMLKPVNNANYRLGLIHGFNRAINK